MQTVEKIIEISTKWKVNKPINGRGTDSPSVDK